MNGSEAMVHTLLAGDVDVCFANPGTAPRNVTVPND